MKQQKEFYAIAQNGTNKFLEGYKNQEHALTFSAVFADDVRCALAFEKGNKESEEAIYNIAKAVGGRMVKVKAEYEITERMDQNCKNQMKVSKNTTSMPLIAYSKKLVGL